MIVRMSCNGCRVLRKGCGSDCIISPCLDWINNPEYQANATLFLAKFYGRAGLVNLIGNTPTHQRPAAFRSLLYEACGRIVNPIYGSVGLLSTGNWQSCQAAVDAVLKGQPIVPCPVESPPPTSDAAAADTGGHNIPPPMFPSSYDIRHAHRVASTDPSRHQSRSSGSRRRRQRSRGDVVVELDLTLGLERNHDLDQGCTSGGPSTISQPHQ